MDEVVGMVVRIASGTFDARCSKFRGTGKPTCKHPHIHIGTTTGSWVAQSAPDQSPRTAEKQFETHEWRYVWLGRISDGCVFVELLHCVLMLYVFEPQTDITHGASLRLTVMNFHRRVYLHANVHLERASDCSAIYQLTVDLTPCWCRVRCVRAGSESLFPTRPTELLIRPVSTRTAIGRYHLCVTYLMSAICSSHHELPVFGFSLNSTYSWMTIILPRHSTNVRRNFQLKFTTNLCTSVWRTRRAFIHLIGSQDRNIKFNRLSQRTNSEWTQCAKPVPVFVSVTSSASHLATYSFIPNKQRVDFLATNKLVYPSR